MLLAMNRFYYEEHNRRLPALFQALKDYGDFYCELKWEVRSWVPLVSRFCPYDTYKIWKKGSRMRIDSTIVGFENLKFVRGHISFLFNCYSDDHSKGELLIVDHGKKNMELALQTLLSQTSETVADDVDVFMKYELVQTFLAADEINLTPVKGWFGGEKKEKIGSYNAAILELSGFSYSVIHRTSSLLSKDQQKLADEAKLSSLLQEEKTKDGSSQISFLNYDKKEARKQEAPGFNMEQYFSDNHRDSDDDANGDATTDSAPFLSDKKKKHDMEHHVLLYPSEKLNWKKKDLKGITIWFSKEFPRRLDSLIVFLDILAPSSPHLSTIKQIITQKMNQHGFPIKIDVPVYPTVTASAWFLTYDESTPIEDSIFAIPNYQLVSSVKKQTSSSTQATSTQASTSTQATSSPPTSSRKEPS